MRDRKNQGALFALCFVVLLCAIGWQQGVQIIGPTTSDGNVSVTLNGTISGGDEVPLSVDSSTNSLQVIDYSHHEIHSASHYNRKNWLDITGAGTTVDFLIVTPDTTKWAHLVYEFAGEAEFTLTAYEATTTSADGTPLSTFNNQRNSANTAGVTLYSGPTVTDVGDEIWATKIGSSRNDTEGSRNDDEWVLKQNTKYLLRVVKVATGTHWFAYNLEWYEHTDKN